MLTEKQSIPDCCNAVMSMSRTLLSCSTDALEFLSSAVTPLSSALNALAFDEALIFINWSRTALSSVTSALFFLSSTAAPWSSAFASCWWNRLSVPQESFCLWCHLLTASPATAANAWLACLRHASSESMAAMQWPPHGCIASNTRCRWRMDGVLASGRSLFPSPSRFVRELPLGASRCSCNAAKLALAAELHPSASSLSYRRGRCGNSPSFLPAHDLTYARVVQA
jgi:hypothetical protein